MEQFTCMARVMEDAGRFCIKYDLNYLSADLICYACLQQSAANAFLTADEIENLSRTLLAYLAKTPKLVTTGQEESFPMDLDASIVWDLGMQYAYLLEDGELDCAHFLLAILSCNFYSTQLLKNEGWVFRNYMDRLLMEQYPGIQIDGPLSAPTGYIPRNRSLPLLQKLFSAESKRRLSVRYLDDALRLIKFGDFERAMIALRKSEHCAPLSYEYFSKKIYILQKCKHFREAVDTIHAARTIGFTATIADYRFGRNNENLFIESESFLQLSLGNFEASIARDLEALTLSPTKPLMHYNNIGFSYQNLDRFSESISWFDKALAIEPLHAFTLNNKGYSVFKNGDAGHAIELINKSLGIDKGNSYAYRNLALIAKAEGDYSVANAMRQKAFLFGYKEDFGDDLDDL